MVNDKRKGKEHGLHEDRAAFALWLLSRFEGWSHAPVADVRVDHAEDRLRSRLRTLIDSQGAGPAKTR